jgi:hypothetical protein
LLADAPFREVSDARRLAASVRGIGASFVYILAVDRSIMTIALLDSLDERIRHAVAEKRLLEIRYKRGVRLAEPHDYGVIDGTARLLIFQLHGPDSGEGAVGWRLLDVVRIESCVVTEQTFAGSRGQSHQQHYQWETLYARVT